MWTVFLYSRETDGGLVLYGRLGFLEHADHAKAELAHGVGTVFFKPLDVLISSCLEPFTIGAGHQVNENIEIEYNRLFFVFHRHILVVLSFMTIL